MSLNTEVARNLLEAHQMEDFVPASLTDMQSFVDNVSARDLAEALGKEIATKTALADAERGLMLAKTQFDACKLRMKLAARNVAEARKRKSEAKRLRRRQRQPQAKPRRIDTRSSEAVPINQSLDQKCGTKLPKITNKRKNIRGSMERRSTLTQKSGTYGFVFRVWGLHLHDLTLAL